MNNKHYVGKRVSSFQRYDDIGPVTGIALVVDDDNEYLAGDQNGYVLEVPCSYGTQAMADQLLAAVRGKVYKGYTANKAALTPRAELGDGVTVNGLYGLLATRSFDFGGGCYATISAPGENIIEHKYPIQITESAKLKRSLNRKIADTQSSITKTAEEIRLEISSSEGRSRSYIDQRVNSITLSVTGSLGGEASIRLSGGGGGGGTVDLSKVRSAFANDQTAIDINAGTVTFNSNTFIVNSTNFGVTADGTIRSIAGTIGGYTIDSTTIYGSTAGISSDLGKYAFWAGETNGAHGAANTNALFRVGGDGTLIATGASVSGNINADSGTFNSVTITGSSFAGTLNSATGSVNGITGSLNSVSGSYVGTISSGGTFTGTHSGGSLSSTNGSYYGYVEKMAGYGQYSGEVWSGSIVSCGTNGTSFGVAGGGSITAYSGATAYGNGGVTYVRSGSAYHAFNGSRLSVPGELVCDGNFTCNGVKERSIRTEHYGRRNLSAFETPMPTFSDYGTGMLDGDGVFDILIDPVFAETVDKTYLPTVFLTRYGQGDLWVARVEHDAVLVRGTPGLRFAWETRYAQANAGVDRLRIMDFDYQDLSHETDYNGDAALDLEFHSTDYQREGTLYFEGFERSLTT